MAVFAGLYTGVAEGLAGAPLPAASVAVKNVGTQVNATIYTDRTKAVAAANPVIADSLGNFTVYAAPGLYDLVCNGKTITVEVGVDAADLVSWLPEVASNEWVAKSAISAPSTAFGNGDARFHRLFVPGKTYKTIAVAVTVGGSAGAVIRMGVYAWQGNGLPPGALLFDAGTVAATGTSETLSIAINQTLPLGFVWIGAVGQGAPTTPPTWRYLGSTVDVTGRYSSVSGGALFGSAQEYAWSISGGAAGALPASPVWTAAYNSPIVGLQAA